MVKHSRFACCCLLVACATETPTTAVVENAYTGQTAVYRTWWAASYFREPVAAGAASPEERSIPGSFAAYALLAPGWDPASPSPPTKLVALKSKTPLDAARGEMLHIEISDRTFAGNCAAGQPLSQEDADFVTTRIFPGEFVDVRYDARTCQIAAAPR
jgi:hypothetical protein